MTEMRERRIALGSLQLAVAIPETSANRVASSALYRTLVRPARGLVRRGYDNESPAPSPVPVRNPWALPDLLLHPDGHLRHARLAAAISAVLTDGSLLSVGDPFCQMAAELSGFEITYTDLSPVLVDIPGGAHYVQADFTADGLFAERSFDVVCSTDTLEHIAAPKRSRFLERAISLARQFAFIAFPAGPDARAVESIIRTSRSRTAFRDALDEHAVHGLPELDDIETCLSALGVAYSIRPMTTVAEWLSSFVFGPGDWEQPELVLDYWEFLNRAAPREVGAGPTYRYLVEVCL